MTQVALQVAGMIDANGNWTGKYGVHSHPQFLGSPEAQEMALTDYLNDIERQLQANGSFDYLGTVINGRVAPFTVTTAGLIAAGHREGARYTRDYLGVAASFDFVTRGRDLSTENKRVETRLRTFADATYE
jgi:hypothetical protein